MFADLVGSTALSTRLDPEDLSDVMAAHHRIVADMVARFDGYVARYLGDGVLAYFGYPQAHEDDPERAIRAGLAIVERTKRLNTVAGPPGALLTRVGVASGVVVVGEQIGTGSASEINVVGDTPNMAARLQVLARPATVVVCEATRHLAGGIFTYEPLEAQEVRGFDDLKKPALVIGESGVDSRFEARRTGAAGLVNREAELAALRQAWADAAAGHGRVAVLRGDAGVGKSRLLAAVREHVQLKPHFALSLICSPHHQDTALYPVTRELARSADFRAGDTTDTRLGKLRDLLSPIDPVEDAVAIMADLLDVPGSATAAEEAAGPRRRKEITFATVLSLIQTLSMQRPVLVLLEDLHWADPTTLELVGRLVATASDWSVLVMLTTRPSPLPIWASHPNVLIQDILPLKRHEAALLVRNATGEHGLPDDVVERIVARADGIPLFIEELTKSAVESGLSVRLGMASAPIAAGIPVSLQAALLERLDRRPAAKHVAQAAAVMGREFSLDLLRHLTDMPEDRLAYAIRELEDADILVPRGVGPNATLSFRHALVQDVAYASLLRDGRRFIHRRLAEALEKGAGGPTAEPEVLAFHFGEAGLLEQSIANHLKAAEKATGRSALAERVAQLHKALKRRQGLLDSAYTLSLELQLQVALGQALIDHLGSGNDAVRLAFERARDLCLSLGETLQLQSIQDGLINFHFTRSEASDLLRIADETADQARRGSRPQTVLLSHRAAGLANMLLGRFADARDNFRRILAMYDITRDGPGIGVTARDTRVAMTTMLGISLTALGDVSAGIAASMDGITHAERLNHVPSLILGLRRACVQRMMCNDAAGTLPLAERLVEISTDYETYLGPREGSLFLHWAKARLRPDPALLSAVKECLSDLKAAQHFVLLPFFIGCAAALYGELSDPYACELLDQAEDLIEITGERWCEPEILRLRARYATTDDREAAGLLQRAIAIARSQTARLWELRCAIDLAPLALRGACPAFPTPMSVLEPVLARYTDTYETPDLLAARRLLQARPAVAACG